MKKIFLPLITVFAITNYCNGQNLAEADPIPAVTYSNSDAAKDTILDASTHSGNDIYSVFAAKPKRQVPWYVEKFKLTAGVFLPSNKTNIQLGANEFDIGTDVNFEDDLGFKKHSQTFLADIQWRSSSRSRFDLSYININRSSSATLQRTIEFGDHTYTANANVEAFFNTTIYRFSYGYAILSKPTYELGLMIGAHVVKLGTGLALSGGNISAVINDNYHVTAPLPDFGLWGGFTIGPRWAVNGEFGYLALTVNDISGRILTYNFSTTYRIVKNLDITAAYQGLNFKVDAVKDDLNGYIKWGYNGPSFTLSYSFGQKGWL